MNKKNSPQSFLYYQLLKRHYFALTGPIRVLPDFLIIGAKRCGTTSLFYHLPEHPMISKSHHDNMGFFNDNFHLGVNWYKSFFPTIFVKNKFEKKFGKFLSFDVTSKYMEDECTANNIKKTEPDMKIIVILRNPVDRAYSQFHVSVKEQTEQMNFEDAVSKEIEKLKIEFNEKSDEKLKKFPLENFHYIKKGLYAMQLKSWFRIFHRENILVLSTEEFEKNQDKIYKKIFNFLEIDDFKIKNQERMQKGHYPPMNTNIRNVLLDFFKPHNDELFSLIGEKFDWDN